MEKKGTLQTFYISQKNAEKIKEILNGTDNVSKYICEAILEKYEKEADELSDFEMQIHDVVMKILHGEDIPSKFFNKAEEFDKTLKEVEIKEEVQEETYQSLISENIEDLDKAKEKANINRIKHGIGL